MLCSAILSVLAWLLLTAVGFMLYGRNLDGVDNRTVALVLLNSFTFTIVAMSVAALCGSFVKSVNSQNAVANIITLALCFLGGVFVPLSIIGDGILVVSRFLPTYWNVIALERISALTSFEAGALQPIWQAMFLQLAFAGAIFCVALVIGKHLGQSERYHASMKTEIEA